MEFNAEINAFIKDFVRDLHEDSAAIFAGAGLSKSAGFVDWPELLRDIASELGLTVEKETDLISLAQFHVNQKKGAGKLTRKILEEFSEQAEPSESHEILARLPIRSYWTTNYDTLLEDALRKAYRIPDIKHTVAQLNTTRPKRDAVVYKMHGDVNAAGDAVLYKEQYELYYRTHEAFVTALSGDLVSKTFLFIGFSFTDPNLDYVLSRLHTIGMTKRPHYCFMKRVSRSKDEDEELHKYAVRKQELRVDDLRRFGIHTLLLDDYADIPRILKEIQRRFLKATVFISGSAEEFGDWARDEATGLIHTMAAKLVGAGYRIVNGFGWGVGSAVINGALETIYSHPEKHSEDQLVMRPFPQFPSSSKDLKSLWEEYRQRMISLSGVAIFLFGNKRDSNGNIIEAGGVIREFEIAVQHGLVPIPIGGTGFASQTIWEQIARDPERFYGNDTALVDLVSDLCSTNTQRNEILEKLFKILKHLGK